MIKCIADYQIIFGLVLNISLIRARGIRLKILGLEINDEISIHNSHNAIRNKDSSGMDGSVVDSVLLEGRSEVSSVNTKYFFDLDLMNSKSNSCKMMIHFEYFPPRN